MWALVLSDCPHRLHVGVYCSATLVPAWWLLAHDIARVLKAATRVSTDVVSRAYSLLALQGRWLRRQGLFILMAQWLFSATCCVSSHKAIRCHFMSWPIQGVANDCQNWGSSPGLPFFTQVSIGARQSIRNCTVKSKPRLRESFWISMPRCLSYLCPISGMCWSPTLFWSAERKPGWIL